MVAWAATTLTPAAKLRVDVTPPRRLKGEPSCLSRRPPSTKRRARLELDWPDRSWAAVIRSLISRSLLVIRLICLCSAAVLAAACSARQGEIPKLTVEPLAGHVTTTATGTWFVPCGAAEGASRWWVTYVDASVRQAEQARKEGLLALNQRTFVRWRASRTDEKLVGPGGPALLVRDIFEIRAPKPGDCTGQDR